MTFKKGESGNPAGRPRKSGVRLKELRDRISEHGEELLDKAIAMALEGEVSMLRYCIDKILPSYRSVDCPVELSEVSGRRSLYRKALAIVDRIAEGEITASEGKDLLTSVSEVYKIKEYSEFEKRLAKIEEAQKGDDN